MTNGFAAHPLMHVDHFLISLIAGHFAGKIAGEFVESIRYEGQTDLLELSFINHIKSSKL